MASLTPVLASTGALALGPLFVAVARRRRGVLQAVDAFVLVAIVGIAALHVLPEAIEQAGLPALIAATVGFAAPLVLERVPRRERGATSVENLGILALALHAFVDGAALALSRGPFLALATILHRVPEGIVVWTLARNNRTARHAVLILCGVAAVNALGAAVGVHIAAVVRSDAVSMLQAFAMGTLVHVLLDRSSLDEPAAVGTTRSYGVLGAACAAVAVAAVTRLAPDHMVTAGPDATQVFATVLIRSTPGVLGGLGLACALKWIAARTPFPTIASLLEAIAVGQPLPDARRSTVVASGLLAPVPIMLTWIFFGSAYALTRVILGVALASLMLFVQTSPPATGVGQSTQNVHILELVAREGLGIVLASAFAAIVAPTLPADANGHPSLFWSMLAGVFSPLQGGANVALAGANATVSTFAFVLVAAAANVRALRNDVRASGVRSTLFLLASVLVASSLALIFTRAQFAMPGPRSPSVVDRSAALILAVLAFWGLARREPRTLIREVLGLHRSHA